MSNCVNNFEWKLVLLLEIIILSLILLLLSANVHAIHTYIIMQELEKEDVALKNHSNNGLAMEVFSLGQHAGGCRSGDAMTWGLHMHVGLYDFIHMYILIPVPRHIPLE